jgi:hypothetical protein
LVCFRFRHIAIFAGAVCQNVQNFKYRSEINRIL